MAGTNITFNGNSLQTFNGSRGILAQDIEHAGQITQLAPSYPIAHANLSALPNVNWPNRLVTLTGTIIGTSIVDCDSLIDTFNSYMLAKGANLDVDYNGGTRRYIATPTNPIFSRPDGLQSAVFSVSFFCTMPFGMDTSTSTILSASGRTLASYQDVFSFLGSAPTQLPIFTITLTAVTGGTNQPISIGNDATGQMLTVLRTWAAADVLVIDTTKNTVTVNGVTTDFSGAFPQFAPQASGTIDYVDGFATRTITVSYVYTPLYL